MWHFLILIIKYFLLTKYMPVYLDNDEFSSVRSSEIEPKDKRDKKCAPHLKFENGSCMTLDMLIELVKIYNESYNNKIKLCRRIETANPERYKKYLVREIGKRLDDVCDNQRCWLKQSFARKLASRFKEEEIYRPKGPEGKFDWLNTLNINDVMRQYEKKYNNFKYLGTHPIDFDELDNNEVRYADFAKLEKEGKQRLGCVFNLDEHYKSGSHWVGLFINLKKGQVYFFDSYGVRPDPRIRTLMRRVGNYIEKNGSKCDIDYNDVRNQYGGNACGVYSMSFILRMLRGDTFEDIKKNPIKDNEMNKCRDVYFN